MKPIHSKIVIIALIFAAFIYPGISAAESTSHSKISDELIARKLKKLDPSLATSVEAVRYTLKRNCKPCGEKTAEDSAGFEINRPEQQ